MDANLLASEADENFVIKSFDALTTASVSFRSVKDSQQSLAFTRVLRYIGMGGTLRSMPSPSNPSILLGKS
jgi:hypothetical protein